MEIGAAGYASCLLLPRSEKVHIYKNEHLIFTEDQTPCQTYRFQRIWENQHKNERRKCSYPIENREEIRDGNEVQEEVSTKVPLTTSLEGKKLGSLEDRACEMKCRTIPHMH